MGHVRVDLDRETYKRLMKSAVSERRPPGMQAEVLLRRALGVDPAPVTPPVREGQETPPPRERGPPRSTPALDAQ